LEVAGQIAESFFDGAVFVPLAPLRDASLVTSAIARRVGVREGDPRPLDEHVIDSLRPRETLLLLDNFEHLIEAGPVVSALLDACPSLKVLVTSRAPLRVRGEHQYAVAPLALPTPDIGLDALASIPAVTLLIERAHARRPDFTLTQENARAISTICHRLDGLPLALELAAVRLALFSPQELLARLDHTLDILADGPRDVPAHQRTLRATLEWSHDLLSPSEQAVFRRLAVCASGCALEDAEYICVVVAAHSAPNESVTGEPDLLRVMERLVDQNVVRRWEAKEDKGGAQARIGMLDVVREYACEKLRASGEERVARTFHAERFAALAETAALQLAGPEQEHWLERLDLESENMRAALDWSLAEQDCAETGLRLAGSLWRYWFHRGALAEGLYWMGRILERWRWLSQPPSPGSQPSTDARQDSLLADAFYGAGVLAFTRSDFTSAQSWYEASMALRQRLSDMRGVAQALNGLGGIAREQGRFDEALALYAASLTAFEDQPRADLGQANARNNIGLVWAACGEYSHALTSFQEALAGYRRLQNRFMIGRCLANIGYCLCEMGDLRGAQTVLDESLSLHRGANDEHGVALTLATLGFVAARQGAHATAERLWIEAAGIYQRVGGAISVVQCLEELAMLWVSQGSEPVDSPREVCIAVSILAAADAMRGHLGAPPEPIRAERITTVLTAALQVLGDHDYDLEWRVGQALVQGNSMDETLTACLALIADDGC
jgi:predicted ATPase